MYSYENRKWIFERDFGDNIESDTVAIIFDQDDPFDTLLKHESADRIKTLFLSDKYSELAKTGVCRLIMVMVEVPPLCCETLNSISTSKWCSKLLQEANARTENVLN